MNSLAVRALCLVVLPLATAVIAAPQTRWVSDQLPLDMRSGNSNAHRVIKMLDPGTKVTLLKVDTEQGFSMVVTEDGTKGWLANRYLMKEPAGRSQLAKAQATIASLTADAGPRETNIAELEQENETLRLQLTESTQSNSALASELAHIKEVSANAVALDESHQTLMEANQVLQHQIDVLKGENDRLGDSSQREWFLNGALAVGLGVLLAIVIPRFAPKPKHNEWR